MKCDICQTTIFETDNQCSNCGIKLPFSIENRRNFRDLIVDIEYWFVNLSKQKLILIFLFFYFLFGSILLWIIEPNIPVTIFYSVLCISYALIVIFHKSQSKSIAFQYLTLAFYTLHTALELILNYVPRAILFTLEDGWFGFIPIVLSLLPIVFILIRIILVYYFVTGLNSSIKLSKNEVATNYFLKTKK